MFKKFGISSKDLDPPTPPFSSNTPNTSSSLSAPTSPQGNLGRSSKVDRDREKRKAAHNKKVLLRTSTSYESLDSAPRPHLPDSVYHPNPFPFDPSQPDGKSRQVRSHQSGFVREEVVDVDVEETRGFVSGRLNSDQHQHQHLEQDEVEDVEYELVKKHRRTEKFSAGFKSAMAKTGLGGPSSSGSGVQQEDAVLYHLQQQQHQQQLQRQSIESPPKFRGRERERQRTMSGPLSAPVLMGDAMDAMGGSRVMSKGDPFKDPRSSRVQSSSPPPAPGQERRSASYWPEGSSHPRDSRDSHPLERNPFLGYQPPRTSSPGRHPPPARSSYQQQRPTSQGRLSDYEDTDQGYGHHYRPSREGRHQSSSHDQRPSRIAAAREGGAGVRRHSGLNNVMNAASVERTSSEYDENESPRRPTTEKDRLSRAKEWVANHSNNPSISQPSPAALAMSTPGAFPRASGPALRLSTDSEDMAMLTPPRGSFPAHAGGGGSRDSGGYDVRERMAILDQMQMQGLSRSRRDSGAAGEDAYYHRERERERYWQNRLEYEYEYGQHQGRGHGAGERRYSGAGGGGGYPYGYPAGVPDDVEDDAESTLAPGSAVIAVDKTKKAVTVDTMPEPAKAAVDGANVDTPAEDDDVEEGPLAMERRIPNRKRLILRLVTLVASVLVIVLLVAAGPVSGSSAPFTSKMGLVVHYVVAVLSIIVSTFFVVKYFGRRMKRQPKLKRYILIGMDSIMALAWFIDVFFCISRFPCAVGGEKGWCDMYNSSIFLGMVALVCYTGAIGWDIWGSFDHPKRSLIKAPPPMDKRALAMQGARPGRGGGGMMPGGLPGAQPGYPMKAQGGGGWGGGKGGGLFGGKSSKALW